MSTPSTPLRLAAVVLVILLTGLGAGMWNYRRARQAAIAELTIDARRCSLAFQLEEMRRLTGAREDLQTATYRTVKDRLIRLRSVHRSVGRVYLARHFPDTGQTVFLADSEPADSSRVALPGDEHPGSPGLQAVIRTGQPAVDVPRSGRRGEWAKGYAFVFEHGAASGAGSRDVLGLDIAAGHWGRDLLPSGLAAALYVWLLLGVPIGLLFALRRHSLLDTQVRKLAMALEQGHCAAMIIDHRNRVEYVNAGLCRQTGYTREELVGRDWRELAAAEAPEATFAEIRQCVLGGHSWVGHWNNRRKDGTAYPVRSTVTPVADEEGRIVSCAAVLDDMTLVEQREAELRAAKERAEAGDHAKGQFLATMSHEVRTPLNGIVGFTSLLLDTPLTPEQREYVQTIRTSSEALIHLTTELLDLSRIEAGKLELSLQPCAPRDLLEDALEILATRAAEKNLELLHHVAADVPARIRTDPVRLRQILVNLIGNAVKFTATGEIAVTVRRAGDHLSFTVRDTGPGIAPADFKKIFKPFSQLDSSATRRFGGAGLGLAISRSLALALGGDIGIESMPGGGASFTFSIALEELELNPATASALKGRRLALVVPHAGLRAELTALAAEWGATTIRCEPAQLTTMSWDLALIDGDAETLMTVNRLPLTRRTWPAERIFGLVPINLPGAARTVLRPRFRLLLNKPLRHAALHDLLAGTLAPGAIKTIPAAEAALALHVLVVEDNRVNQVLLQRILEGLGCEWVTVPNGQRAVEELAVRSYDVVLMDLHMPELDGVSATRLIRAGEAGAAAREVWIAVVSADSRTEQRERAFAAGVNDYLHKPVTIADVEEALRRYLDERRKATGEGRRG